ncbi:MAG: hypothetical protein E7672_09185 [Ruminococcaceae bacterium]|nr:hypothetical protein [Oscillospiraceae bacterium]
MIALITAGLIVFSDFIRAYEASQPDNTAFDYVGSVTKEQLSDMLKSGLKESPYSLEKPETVISAYIDALPEGDYECRRMINMGSTQNPVYGLYGDGLLLAHITLAQDSADKYGFSTWRVDKTEILPNNLRIEKKTYSVYAPVGSLVTVNGVVLTEDQIADKIAYPFVSEFEEQVGAPYLVMYEINDILSTPVIECEKNGMICSLAESAVANELYFKYPSDETKSYDIVAPEGSVITVNGVTLAEQFASDIYIPYTYSTLEEGCDNLPTARKYTVSGLFSDPQVAAEFEGIPLSFKFDSQELTYTADYPQKLLYSCEVTVPYGSTVTLHGNDCSSYKTTDTLSPYEMLFGGIGEPPLLEVYRIDGLYLQPDELDVLYGGISVEIEAEQDGRKWTYGAGYPEVSDQTVEDLALTFIQAYFYYTSQGKNNTAANMENAVQYVAENSELSRKIRNSAAGFTFTPPVTSAVYNVLEIEKLVRITSDSYVCSIEFDVDQMIYNVSRDFAGTVTLYIADFYGQPKVFGMVIDNN